MAYAVYHQSPATEKSAIKSESKKLDSNKESTWFVKTGRTSSPSFI